MVAGSCCNNNTTSSNDDSILIGEGITQIKINTAAATTATKKDDNKNHDGCCTKKETRTTEDNTIDATSNSSNGGGVVEEKKKKPRRRIIRKKKKTDANKKPLIDPVLYDKIVKESGLPTSYNFEIVKTCERIVVEHEKILAAASNAAANTTATVGIEHVAFQMPEGLLMYSTVLADVIQKLVVAATSSSSSTPIRALEISILGDVTYGACCVDDIGAKALGAQLLVHYGHSCLVPIQHTAIPCLYVFVEILIDVPHMIQCVHATLYNNKEEQRYYTIYLLGTVQFRHALGQAKKLLLQDDAYQSFGYQVIIPQVKPLSPGEVLGCTSPKLLNNNNKTTKTAKNKKNDGDDEDETTTTTREEEQPPRTYTEICLFVSDGRFHLESTLISNPHISQFLRYDPYGKTLTEEKYGHEQMKQIRKREIDLFSHKLNTVANSNHNNNNNGNKNNTITVGIILGTLGRQGNPAIIQRIYELLQKHSIHYFVMLLSEITPAKLQLFHHHSVKNNTTVVDAWVQVACPRLSVDWGHYLSQETNAPVLTPFELHVALDDRVAFPEVYPMDYYSNDAGPWANYHPTNRNRKL